LAALHAIYVAYHRDDLIFPLLDHFFLNLRDNAAALPNSTSDARVLIKATKVLLIHISAQSDEARQVGTEGPAGQGGEASLGIPDSPEKYQKAPPNDLVLEEVGASSSPHHP